MIGDFNANSGENLSEVVGIYKSVAALTIDIISIVEDNLSNVVVPSLLENTLHLPVATDMLVKFSWLLATELGGLDRSSCAPEIITEYVTLFRNKESDNTDYKIQG